MKTHLPEIKRLRWRVFGILFTANLLVVGFFVSSNYRSFAEILALTLVGALVSTVCLSLVAAPVVVGFVALRSAYRRRRARDGREPGRRAP